MIRRGSCETCHFWDGPWRQNESQPFLGLCHRYPTAKMTDDPSAKWPATASKDWCGEYKAQ